MEPYKIQIFETLLVVFAYIILYFIVQSVVNSVLKRTQVERGRRKMTIRAVQVFTTIAAIILLVGVWGIKQSEIALFASTILTALGIAFFAQWSLLSNITSSILIFFNHPVKLGDYVKVLHKDYQFEGVVTEMNYFFIHLKTDDNEIVTVPNSHFFDRSFSIMDKRKNQNPTVK
jgi:small-conductance mechanosensitive channel